MNKVKEQFSRIWFHTKNITSKLMSKIFREGSTLTETVGGIFSGVAAGALFIIFVSGLILLTFGIAFEQDIKNTMPLNKSNIPIDPLITNEILN